MAVAPIAGTVSGGGVLPWIGSFLGIGSGQGFMQGGIFGVLRGNENQNFQQQQQNRQNNNTLYLIMFGVLVVVVLLVTRGGK
jgi:hypothetical protein